MKVARKSPSPLKNIRRKSRSPRKRSKAGSPTKSQSPKKVQSPRKSSSILKRIKNDVPFIGKRYEAPAFMRYNPFILRGYRINFTTPVRAIKSLFILNNESFNVWSHLLGALFFVFMVLHVTIHLQPPTM